MERLIHNTNPIPSSKLHLKPTSFLPRLARFHPSKLTFSPTESNRVNSVSCKFHDPFPNFAPLGPSSQNPVKDFPSFSNLADGSFEKKPHFLEQLADAFSHQQKR